MPTSVANHTGANGLAPSIQDYCDRKLLETLYPNAIYGKYGQRRTIPLNNGKTVKYRLFDAMSTDADNSELEEGVVPSAASVTQSQLTATIKQFGKFTTYTDLLSMVALDKPTIDYVKQLSKHALKTMDNYNKSVLTAGSYVYYAGTSNEARHSVASSDILTSTLLRKAVRDLKARDIPTFEDGYYVAIIGPNTEFDLQGDSDWKDVSKYQQAEKIERGEIGRLYGCKIIVSTNPAVAHAENLKGTVRNLTVKTAIAQAAKVITIKEALTSAEATALVGRNVLIGTEKYEIAAAAAGAANAATVTVDEDLTVAADVVIYPGEAGAAGADIGQTLVFGQDCYGTIDLEGHGNTHIIVKPITDGGTSNPLNQFGSIGWKVDGYVLKRLRENGIIRIEHGMTA